jgi:hypothetical protein
MPPLVHIEVILSREEQESWQINDPEIRHSLQERVLREVKGTAGLEGLDSHIDILFQNGARVCTIRLIQSWLYHVDEAEAEA